MHVSLTKKIEELCDKCQSKQGVTYKYEKGVRSEIDQDGLCAAGFRGEGTFFVDDTDLKCEEDVKYQKESWV